MGKLYRVTFTTNVLVEANDENEAIEIGEKNFANEVANNLSEMVLIQPITSISQLTRNERGSLPWRSHERRGEPEETVERILEV